MAKQLREFSFQSRRTIRRYDWDKWFDGKIWELRKGIDFQCKVISFRPIAYNAAAARGKSLRVHISPDGSGVIMQAYDAP